MQLVLGMAGEVPGPYVDCPQERCIYKLQRGVLVRLDRDDTRDAFAEPRRVDPELDAGEHERPRLRRIARMLAESAATARLASRYVVFVPREGDSLTAGISAGSGIVGAPSAGADLIVVHYEGAVHGQVGMARLADRVTYAYGRLVAGYPTKAQIGVPPASLVEIGTFDPASGTITPVDAEAESALAAWLGAEQLDQAELLRGGGSP